MVAGRQIVMEAKAANEREDVEDDEDIVDLNGF